MRTEVATITPQRARDLLELNDTNYRQVDESKVHSYALDMKHGRWDNNGETIKVSWLHEGRRRLLDGQHRLLACVEANESFEALVVYDIDPDTIDTMDWGKKRTLTDLLRRHGYTNTTIASGIVNLSFRWENGLLFVRRYPSPHDAMRWAEQHPEVQTAANLAAILHRRLGSPNSMLGAFIIKAQEYSPEDESIFRHQVMSGAGLDEGNPAFTLRRWSLEGKGREARGDTLFHLAAWIKAWNAWLQGRPMHVVSWRREGAQREPFPIMMDPRKKRQSAAS